MDDGGFYRREAMLDSSPFGTNEMCELCDMPAVDNGLCPECQRFLDRDDDECDYRGDER